MWENSTPDARAPDRVIYATDLIRVSHKALLLMGFYYYDRVRIRDCAQY